MQSVQLLGRSALRLSARPATLRSLSSVPRASFLRPTWQSVKKTSYPAFSTSIARREPAGESDQVLAKKFEHERELENAQRDTSKLPPAIEEFQRTTAWDISDKPGTQIVSLTRTFGNETIKVEFSVDDFNEPEEDELDELDEDSALPDEPYEQPRRTINQDGVRGGKVDVAPEDSIAPADTEDYAEDESAMTAGAPISLNITITKPGDKAILVNAVSDDGVISPHSVSYYPNSSMLNSNSEEAESVYTGPPFTNLDPELQSMFDAYLEERGINASLANMISHYVDHKEQREYCGWLQNMKEFIEA